MGIAIVAGAVAGKPGNGGESWVRMSWVLGLRRLGFDVYFVERLPRIACVDGTGAASTPDASANLAQLRHVACEFGLEGKVALLDEGGESMYGLDAPSVRDLTAAGDVLFDLSGNLGPLAVEDAGCRRVYVDLDPGFTQTWEVRGQLPLSLRSYDRHVTVGSNIGGPRCRIPTAGLDWIPTLPPVVLDEWPPAHEPPGGFRFTTVSTWRTAHGSIALDGRELGLKHHAMRRLIELPERVADVAFELALDIEAADRTDLEALEAHGWQVLDAKVASTPAGYREYVRSSSGEFSVAQPVYVETASGWFSDRTAAYLASGRPALVQDTGARADASRDEGLMTFSTLSQAAELAARIAAEPTAHGQAARAFAERNLDSDVVLGELLQRLGIGG